MTPHEPAHRRLGTSRDDDAHPLDVLAPASLLVKQDARDRAALHPRDISPKH